jgi:hypothetical protein
MIVLSDFKSRDLKRGLLLKQDLTSVKKVDLAPDPVLENQLHQED